MDRVGRSSGHAMSDEQQYGVSGVDLDQQLSEVRTSGLQVNSLREEGGSHADRPRHRQLSCETCCLRLDLNQNRTQCSGCRLWIHDTCTERLKLGTRYQATMCLICQQKATRMFRVANAVELSQGRIWDQDAWFDDLLVAVQFGTSYAVSSNKDLNKLELFMVRVVVNGLPYRQETSEGDDQAEDVGERQSDGTEQASGEPTPIARPDVLRDIEENQGLSSSRVDGDNRMDVDPDIPVRKQPAIYSRSREDSYHSARSNLREERMTSLEQQLHGFQQAINNLIAMQERPSKESSKGDDLQGVGYARTPRAQESSRSQPYVPPTYKTPPPSKAPPVQVGVGASTGDPQPKEKTPEAAERPKVYRAATISPAYQNPEAGIWEQNYLSKALPQMKDSENS